MGRMKGDQYEGSELAMKNKEILIKLVASAGSDSERTLNRLAYLMMGKNKQDTNNYVERNKAVGRTKYYLTWLVRHGQLLMAKKVIVDADGRRRQATVYSTQRRGKNNRKKTSEC